MDLKVLLLTLVSSIGPSLVSSQSNYASRGVHTNYLDDGLPPEAVLNGTVTQLDTLSHAIYTNRTTASLSCATRAMDITMEFKDPFFGIVYANFDRNAACTFLGNGSLKYELQLPLQGCGTIQDPQRVFTNNIVVRFHPSLELEGDEIKTIVCRYPTPTVLPPAPAELPILQPLPPAPEVLPPSKLRGLEIILILCAILFLGLLLLGIGCASYCVKKRNIKLVRTRRAFSSGSGSAITKLSTDFGSTPFFPGLKIPRAHAVDLSDMEHIIDSGRGSQTLSSEYPSETHSNTEIEEGDTRSLRQSTIDSVPPQRTEFQTRTGRLESDEELASQYSDHPPPSEFDYVGPLVKIPRVEPAFDVNVRVKRGPQSNAAYSDSESDFSVVNTMRAQEKFLTSILEREERRMTDSEISEHIAREGNTQPLEDPVVPPSRPNPLYGKVKKRKQPSVFTLSQHSIPENDTWSLSEAAEYNESRSYRAASIVPSEYPSEGREPSVINEVPLTRLPPPPQWKVKINKYPKAPSERPESGTETEAEDSIIPEEPRMAPPQKSATIRSLSEPQALSEFEPQMAMVPHVPNVTNHEADDLFRKNVTETKMYEDEERIKRQMTEYYRKPKQAQPEFDVSIKRHPKPPSVRSESDTDWDQASEIYPVRPLLHTATENVDVFERADRRSPPDLVEPRKPEFDVNIKRYPKPQSVRSESDTDWDQSSEIYPGAPQVYTATENIDFFDRADRKSPPHLVEPRKPEFDIKIKKYTRPPSYATSIPDSITTIGEISEPPRPEFDVRIKKHPRAQSRPATSIPDSETTIHDFPELPEFDVKIKKYPKQFSRAPTSIPDSFTTIDEQPEMPGPDFDVKIKKYPRQPSRPATSIPDSITEYDEEPEELPPVPEFDVQIKKHPKAPSRPATSIPDSVTEFDPEPTLEPEFDVKVKNYPRAPSRPVTSIPDSVTTVDESENSPRPDFDVRATRKQPSVHTDSEEEWEQASDLYIRRSEHYRAIEDEERTIRQTTEYYRRPRPQEPERPKPEKVRPETPPEKPKKSTFDVRIKKYPRPPTSVPETTTSVGELPENPKPEFQVRIEKRPPPPQSERPDSVATDWEEVSDIYRQRTEMTRILEEEERFRRQRTEIYHVPRQLPPNWDVVIKKYPRLPSEHPDSDTSDWDSIPDRGRRYHPRAEADFSFEPPTRPPPPNWDVLIKVLEEPTNDRDDRTSVLTVEDRQKWAELITTDTVFRETITEAIVHEDYETIRRSTHYQKIFEPPKWDVIIRVLQSPPSRVDDELESVTTTYSELPVRYVRRDGKRPTGSRRTSLTSAKSDFDIRSLPEDVVTFAKRRQDPDAWSQSSGYTYKSSAYPRSMADRSHAETEIVDIPFLDLDEVDSRSDRPKSSRYTKSVVSRPSLARSTSEFTENWTKPKQLFEVASDSERSSARNPKFAIYRRADSSGSEA